MGSSAIRKLPQLDQNIRLKWSEPTPSRGQKAHETVVTFKGVRPSDLHAAIESLGLKPGKHAYGEGQTATGPTVKMLIEITGTDGKTQRLPIEQVLVHRDNRKADVPLKWHFTGSVKKTTRSRERRHGLRRGYDGNLLLAVSRHPTAVCCSHSSP